MFDNPTNIDRSVEEGTVLQVDPVRFLCKVRTPRGQVLQSVQWLSPYGGSTRAGERFTPCLGDRVFVNFGLGYPVITGFFPKLQIENGSSPLSVDSGQQILDSGNYGPGSSVTVGDQNKPRDLIQGDVVFSSIGGAFLGLLRAGTVVLRSSRAAEVLLSKFQRLVRVVSSNWEHFTDLSSDVIRNYKGRVYRYVGYAKDFTEAKTESYRLHEYKGDVTAAESIKTNYHGTAEAAAMGPIISKEQVTDFVEGAPRELMRRTLNLTGEKEIWIFNGTHFTRVNSTAEELRLSWNDQNSVVITEASIHVFHKDGADVILDAAGIRSTFQDGTINMSSSSIDVNFSGTDVELSASSATVTRGGSTGTFTDSNIVLTNGAGTATVSAAMTSIENGAHGVFVSAAGVAVV